MTDNGLKSYIKSYYEDRKITYTKLNKHDRAIGVLINENEKLNKIINKAIEYIESYNLPKDLKGLSEAPISVNELKVLLNILKGSEE